MSSTNSTLHKTTGKNSSPLNPVPISIYLHSLPYHTPTPTLLLCGISSQPLRKGLWIPRLHEHRSRPSELAHQSLSRTQGRYHTSRSHALEHVLAVPGYEVSVVDYVLFVFLELIRR